MGSYNEEISHKLIGNRIKLLDTSHFSTSITEYASQSFPQEDTSYLC